MFAGRWQFFCGPHVRHLWYKLFALFASLLLDWATTARRLHGFIRNFFSSSTRKLRMLYSELGLSGYQPSVYHTKMGNPAKCLSQRHEQTLRLVLHKVRITSYKLREQEWSRDNGAKNVSEKTIACLSFIM